MDYGRQLRKLAEYSNSMTVNAVMLQQQLTMAGNIAFVGSIIAKNKAWKNILVKVPAEEFKKNFKMFTCENVQDLKSSIGQMGLNSPFKVGQSNDEVIVSLKTKQLTNVDLDQVLFGDHEIQVLPGIYNGYQQNDNVTHGFYFDVVFLRPLPKQGNI